MITLTDYSAYSDIRVLLGVSDEELTDADINSVFVLVSVEQHLRSISGVLDPDTETRTLLGHFEYISDIVVGSRTESQKVLFDQIRAYASIAAAFTISGSLGLIAAKTRADGKGTITRFSTESTFIETRKNLSKALQTMAGAVRSTFTSYPVVEGNFTLSVVSPQTDRVTG